MGTVTNLQREIIKACTKQRCLLVVEGSDDSSYYENFLKKIAMEGTYEVLEVSAFGKGAGCTQIVEQLTEIQDYVKNNRCLLKYFRGIIDADVFHLVATEEAICHRKNLLGLITLKYYSYESHALTRRNIKELLAMITYCQPTKLTDDVMDFVMNDLDTKVIQQMYYVGLECLRNAVEKEYQSVFSYDASESCIGDYNRRKHLLESKVDKNVLNEFASDHGLSFSLETVKRIVKGKHLIYACAAELNFLLDSMKNACESSADSELLCSYSELCATKEARADSKCCYWKNKGNFSTDQIYCLLCQRYDLTELNYLIEALQSTSIKFKVTSAPAHTCS